MKKIHRSVGLEMDHLQDEFAGPQGIRKFGRLIVKINVTASSLVALIPRWP